MSKARNFTSIMLLFVFCLAFSCKKQETAKTIIPDSMLTLKIESEQGDNIDPLTNDTLTFSGFPGAIGYFDKIEKVPFLVIGKDLKANKKYDCNYIATMNIKTPKEEKMFVLAFPTDPKHQTIRIESYNELNTEYANYKLWLTDWLKYAYKHESIQKVQWSNEFEVYRKLISNKK